MLIAGKNNGRRTKLLKNFILSIPTTFITITWLKTNMAACVRLLAMTLLLILAVLILYGDLALHIQPDQPQPLK